MGQSEEKWIYRLSHVPSLTSCCLWRCLISIWTHVMLFIFVDHICYYSSQSSPTNSQTVNICDLEKSLQHTETWFPYWNTREVVEMVSVILSFLKHGVVWFISANEVIGFAPSLRSNNMAFLSRILFPFLSFLPPILWSKKLLRMGATSIIHRG